MYEKSDIVTARTFLVSVTYQIFCPPANKDNANMLLFRWQLIISIMSICHMWGLQRASAYQSGLNGVHPPRTDASCPRKCPEPWPWAPFDSHMLHIWWWGLTEELLTEMKGSGKIWRADRRWRATRGHRWTAQLFSLVHVLKILQTSC